MSASAYEVIDIMTADQHVVECGADDALDAIIGVPYGLPTVQGGIQEADRHAARSGGIGSEVEPVAAIEQVGAGTA